MKQSGVKALCQWSKIKVVDPHPNTWDETMKVAKFLTKRQFAERQAGEEFAVTSPALKSSRSSGRRLPPKINAPSHVNTSARRPRTMKRQKSGESHPTDQDLVKVFDIMPEPEYEFLPGKMKEITLKCSAVSDVIKCSLNTTDISFSPTMMFESRVVEVKLSNIAQIKFDYVWHLTKLTSLQYGDSRSQKSPFDITPRSGSIEAGQVGLFRVTFSPEDVDDYTAHLVCEIPHFNSDLPDIFVSGLSRRPICHFNVEMSDYLSAGRRHPDYLYSVPQDVRAFEIFSSGIGQPSTKKFEIINPTAQPYEVFWAADPEHGSPVIKCEYPRMLISSGKRANVVFSFIPVSVKTVESLWVFTIPEHYVKVTFLIVGRIMPA
jgi:hydrocephalus-inducing protein